MKKIEISKSPDIKDWGQNELETLKNVEFLKVFEGYKFKGTNRELVACKSGFEDCKKYLRKEAIKDIKLFRRYQEKEKYFKQDKLELSIQEDSYDGLYYDEFEPVIEYIKLKFNIKESEIK